MSWLWNNVRMTFARRRSVVPIASKRLFPSRIPGSRRVYVSHWNATHFPVPYPSAFRPRRVLPGAASRGRVRQGAEGGAAATPGRRGVGGDPEGRPGLHGVGRNHRRAGERDDPGPGDRLPGEAELPGRGTRAKGAGPLRDRPAHLPGRRGRRQGLPGPGGSPLGNGQGEPATGPAAGGEERREPEGPGRRHRRRTVDPGVRRKRKGAAG